MVLDPQSRKFREGLRAVGYGVCDLCGSTTTLYRHTDHEGTHCARCWMNRRESPPELVKGITKVNTSGAPPDRILEQLEQMSGRLAALEQEVMWLKETQRGRKKQSS
jgi:hypothetical protein